MLTAYPLKPNEKNVSFPELPETVTTKKGERFTFDEFRERDFEGLYKIFEEVVDEGRSYPQDSIDENSFRAYFLTHNCFVIRKLNEQTVVAGVYIKPNFPGRSSHIANSGVIVKMDYRHKALGDILIGKALLFAKQLGFEAVYTNLVFATNEASIKVMERHGFTKVGRLPEAGYLKGLGAVDAFQFYKRLD